ncbi:hypothetical protein [Burkholderia glumae]|uniref:hypothetical protein n=1 Tax=Burkholderia glumae TaxID=337 RepID=UPI002036AD23|nr:hypothetical protein [Burkholderia glumae]MCM2552673.1 hypothetical protein [Burkholderia glumae]MCQ0031460.1 hypothetical protein [Burkholderia glumae]MCQ0035112.1 hypothetical protein [Burkholderia glumae]
MNDSNQNRISSGSGRLLVPLVAASLFAGMASVAHAGPSDCKPGRQDNTCVAFISHAAIPAPMCSAGQRTTTPAKWLGSYWSQPVCEDPERFPTQPGGGTPPSHDLLAECIGRANTHGYAVTEGTTNRTQTRNANYITVQLWPVFGPWYQDVSVYTNQYEYMCNFDVDTLTLKNEAIYDYWMFHNGGGGGGAD